MRQVIGLSLLTILGAVGLLAQEGPPPPPPPPVAPPAGSYNFAWERGGSYLGIGVQEVNAERAKELKLPDVHGVEVTRVEEDSPAAKAGLKENDVVLEYQGQRVEGTAEFVRMVKETPVGRQVKLLVSRGGSSQTLTATVGERKARGSLNLMGHDFTMDPKWQKEMEKMQEQLGKLQFQMPDLPQPNMSWRNRALGIEAETVNSQLAEFFGVKKGVLVRSVGKDTAAEKAGIKAGDVIVKVDNVEVSEPSDISRRVRNQDAKNTFPVTLVRNRQEMTVNVTIEERGGGGGRMRPQRIGVTPQPPQPPQQFRFQPEGGPASPML
ncbi:MAG: PDZ domain-containing protein [Bryobacteraceae bacterium]